MLLTQKYGSQLFLCFEKASPDTFTNGEVRLYALTKPTVIASFQNLFNPVALAAGGDGLGAPLNRVFVLDQGDTCVARANPVSGMCGDLSNGWKLGVSDLRHYWRVRVYGLLGGDTLGTFTDTTVAWVNGIAADQQGRVYVACIAIILRPDPSDSHITTRQFESRVYRYIPGPRYPGHQFDDGRMPGSKWHRDSTWVVIEGSGVGSVQNPHGLDWIAGSASSALYCSDYDKNWIQKLDDAQSSTGEYALDGVETGTFFFQAQDVAADKRGFVYVCDTGNQRVLRYDPDHNFVQRVDIPEVAGVGTLVRPVAVAANDTLVYIADPGAAAVLKLKRLE